MRQTGFHDPIMNGPRCPYNAAGESAASLPLGTMCVSQLTSGDTEDVNDARKPTRPSQLRFGRRLRS